MTVEINCLECGIVLELPELKAAWITRHGFVCKKCVQGWGCNRGDD